MEATMEATIEEADQRALKVRGAAEVIMCRTSYARNESRQAKFAKLKREVIDNVREIFPHGQIIVRGRPGSYCLAERPLASDDRHQRH
jgi:hypothetical protein